MYKIVRAVCFLALFFIATSVAVETITLPGLIRDVWPCKNQKKCGTDYGKLPKPDVTCDSSKCHPDFEYVIKNDRGMVQEQLGSDGKPVWKGGNGDTVHSASSFNKWYNTVEGWNIPIPLNLTLSNRCQGSSCSDTVFTYDNPSFWPINNKGFGNYQDGKNFHFTFELHTRFTYRGGETFKFTGDDDLFIFINEKLVIDLGGVHEAQTAEVKLDDLDLELGKSYPFDLFFAERHTTQSNFRCSTSIEIVCPWPDHCGVCLGDGTSCCTCNDNNLCTTDSCEVLNGTCIFEPITCGNDGNKCLVPSCDPKKGCTTTPLNCDDNNKCTIDACESTSGCSHIPIQCDDNNKCTIDSCDSSTGECVNENINCDDNNECTIDSCDSSSGCSHTNRNCNDGNACTADSCDPSKGCQNVPISCDDGNECTIDSCDTTSGCSHMPIICEAPDACTTASCDPLGGCQSQPVNCDDSNPCTIDSCDPTTGCKNILKPCDDSNPCTSDSCDTQTGDCTYQEIEDCTLCDFVNCTSDDLCSISHCDPSSGDCTLSQKNCDDSNPCTIDTCRDGVCFNDPVVCEGSQDKCNPLQCNRQTGECEVRKVICNDNNLCTNDVCNPLTGTCSYPPVDCSTDEKCLPQTCNGQTGECDVHEVQCDDRNLCTVDSCNSTTGECSFSPVFCETTDACFPASCDGTTGTCQTTAVKCSDGNECTEDLCQDGECIFPSITCDDNDPCTIDTCDPKKGCVFTPVDVSTHCNDNNACTNDTCVNFIGCVHETIPLPKLDNLCQSQYCDRRFGVIVSDIPCRPTDRCTCDPNRGCVCSDPNFFGDLNTEQAAGLGAGIIAVIVLGAAAGVAGLLIGSKKGYDWYHGSQGAKQTVVQDNPLYETNNSTVENPLFEEP